MSADDDDHQIGYQALPRGVPVRASGGEQIGTVRRVLDNAREHIFDGLVIDTPSGRRFVDAPEVARITRRAVTLNIDAAGAAERRAPVGGRDHVGDDVGPPGRSLCLQPE